MTSPMEAFMQQFLQRKAKEAGASTCTVSIKEDSARGVSRAVAQKRQRAPAKTAECVSCRWLSIQPQDKRKAPEPASKPQRTCNGDNIDCSRSSSRRPPAITRSSSEPQMKQKRQEGRPKLPIRRSSSQSDIQTMKKSTSLGALMDIPRMPRRTLSGSSRSTSSRGTSSLRLASNGPRGVKRSVAA